LDSQIGNYIVTVTTNGGTGDNHSFTKLNLKVVDASLLPPQTWTVVDSTIRDDMEKGVFDRERGLAYFNQGANAEGRAWLRRALAADHSDEFARARLVEAYFSLQDYAAACTGGGVPQSAAIAASQADIALPIQYPNKLVAIGATPAAFIRDPHNLRITLSVNGAMKQNASTAGMIYWIDEQLSSISQFVTLEPGDVVLTGSPAGVGLPRGEFLKPGDKVIATAEGVGELHMEIA